VQTIQETHQEMR